MTILFELFEVVDVALGGVEVLHLSGDGLAILIELVRTFLVFEIATSWQVTECVEIIGGEGSRRCELPVMRAVIFTADEDNGDQRTFAQEDLSCWVVLCGEDVSKRFKASVCKVCGTCLKAELLLKDVQE